MNGVLLALIVGCSPLLAGSVHRVVVTAILVITLAAFACAIAGERLKGASLRGRESSVLFLLLLLIPILQVVPLPSFARALIDPGGIALLENAPNGVPRAWPFSLDPQATRGEIGTAAAALIVFLLAVHVASGRRHRKLVLGGIAVAGILGTANGIAHRIFGIDQLFGMFPASPAVLPGPFINPNHSAEFYELAAFAAVALAQDSEAEFRVGWYVAACVSAAAALTTLSRGSFLALSCGGAVFALLRWRRADEAGELAAGPNPYRLRQTIVWSLVALGCLVAVALALGAAPVWDEVAQTKLTSASEKVVVWKDSLALVARHPLGIGRHAFDRVYPVYKSLPSDIRFQFVENGPLQLLIDTGWLGLLALILGVIWIARKISWRRDDVGAALVGALAAVMAHNLVDFGIETMGIRLPFAAVAGIAVGRGYARQARDQVSEKGYRGLGFVAATTAIVGTLIGLGAQFQTDAEDLERRWKAAVSSEARREIAVQGSRSFPTDFYFPLLQSYDEPLKEGVKGGLSPRLAALNRSLRLCPTCAVVHEQVARVLLRLGLRAQALSSFRDTVRLVPSRLPLILRDLDLRGFDASNLATLAVGGGSDLMIVARYLVPKKAAHQVEDLLAQAGEKGVSPVDRLLVQSDLALTLGRLADARSALGEAIRLSPRDGRSHLALSHLDEKEGHLDAALERARTAATLSPFDVEFARRRLGLILRMKRWAELDDALERLKLALRQHGQPVTEIHLVAGQTHELRRNLGRALAEYRMAVTLERTNSDAWLSIGRVLEAGGDLNGALDAYQHLAVLRPDDGAVRQAVERVENERAGMRLRQLLP